MRKQCKPCHASGKLMGLGMITSDCDTCDGEGFIYEPKAPSMDDNEVKDVKQDEEIPKSVLAMGKAHIDKRSVGYKKAIAEIQGLYPEMTLAEAKLKFEKVLRDQA